MMKGVFEDLRQLLIFFFDHKGIFKYYMTQAEKWQEKYNEVVRFIELNHRNPSRYDAEERGLYCNWLKHNKKCLKSGIMKPERVRKFNQLLNLMEQYKHVNQYA